LPIFGEGAIVQLGRDLRDYQQLLRVQAVTLATVIPIGLIAAALLAWFLTARAMRPIREMGLAAAAIGRGNFDERIPVVGADEFAELGTRFNEMAAALGASFAQQKASYEALAKAYEQQRQFVADASHELRTPLTRLQLVTSEALSDPNADTRRAVEVADGSARAMAALVRQLLELAQADAGELRPQRQDVDLRALVADVVDEMQDREVDVHLGDTPRPASIDPVLVARALTNLIDNAKRYGAGSRSPVVTVGQDHGVGTWIEVRDFGTGIPAEHLPHVKKRFYRADQARTRELGGTGLGLAIVDEIMRAHGGHLEIESTEGQGTVARLVFP
jgi:two-component system sensor histidine kinase MtrB